MIWIILWIVFAILVGVGAHNWRRSGIGWFLLACVISPVIAGVALLILGRKQVPTGKAEAIIAVISRRAEMSKGKLEETVRADILKQEIPTRRLTRGRKSRTRKWKGDL